LQDVTNHDTEIVAALRAALADVLGPTRYDLWFGAETTLELSHERLRVISPSAFLRDWLRSHVRREMDAACQSVLGRTIALEFDCRTSEVLDTGVPAVPLRVVHRDANAERRVSPRTAIPASTSQVVEKPPESNRRPFSRLETFVVGRANRVAYTSAQMVADRPGSLNPLFLHGPTGVGKTHLMEGVWSSLRGRPGHHVVYLSSEQFTSSFLDALNGKGLPLFRSKYRGVDALLIDDVQFLCGKKATIGELLHTVDTLLRAGKQVVLSADRPPAELHGLGSELLTRLASGMQCLIDPPDYETRLGIVRQLSRKMRVDLPSGVEQYVAAHLTSHARELSGALNVLKATSQALDQPISLSLAEEALAERIRHNARAVKLADIEQAVCQVFGLSPESLHGAGKTRELSGARTLAMWLARKHTRAALSEIGRYFGRRSHSTVITAQKKVTSWMADGRPLELSNRNWGVEEAIRRVEAQLCVG
jgi:chromosomal replication initiator protein